MSMIMDPRASDLIEALKDDSDNFILSNLIFKNHGALRSVFEYYGLMSDLLEFAKDPEIGIERLGPEPQKPTQEFLSSLPTDRERERAIADYEQMLKIYRDMKKAAEMHVPYSDFIMINNYMEKYQKTMHATPAVKGLRFKAFTKDVEHEEKSTLSKLFNRAGQQ